MARQLDAALRQTWRELISRQQRSGLSIARFCETQGISTASFYKWRREFSQMTVPQRQAFLPVEVLVTEPSDDAPLRVRLTAGAVIEIPPQRTDVLLAVIEKIQTSLPHSRLQQEHTS
jgi:transposase-like protein